MRHAAPEGGVRNGYKKKCLKNLCNEKLNTTSQAIKNPCKTVCWTVSRTQNKAIDSRIKTRQFAAIPRGASYDAEMAVSRTLEPDPGRTGVGTETAAQSPLFSSPLAWISVIVASLEIVDDIQDYQRCR